MYGTRIKLGLKTKTNESVKPKYSASDGIGRPTHEDNIVAYHQLVRLTYVLRVHTVIDGEHREHAAASTNNKCISNKAETRKTEAEGARTSCLRPFTVLYSFWACKILSSQPSSSEEG